MALNTFAGLSNDFVETVAGNTILVQARTRVIKLEFGLTSVFIKNFNCNDENVVLSDITALKYELDRARNLERDLRTKANLDGCLYKNRLREIELKIVIVDDKINNLQELFSRLIISNKLNKKPIIDKSITDPKKALNLIKMLEIYKDILLESKAYWEEIVNEERIEITEEKFSAAFKRLTELYTQINKVIFTDEENISDLRTEITNIKTYILSNLHRIQNSNWYVKFKQHAIERIDVICGEYITSKNKFKELKKLIVVNNGDKKTVPNFSNLTGVVQELCKSKVHQEQLKDERRFLDKITGSITKELTVYSKKDFTIMPESSFPLDYCLPENKIQALEIIKTLGTYYIEQANAKYFHNPILFIESSYVDILFKSLELYTGCKCTDKRQKRVGLFLTLLSNGKPVDYNADDKIDYNDVLFAYSLGEENTSNVKNILKASDICECIGVLTDRLLLNVEARKTLGKTKKQINKIRQRIKKLVSYEADPELIQKLESELEKNTHKYYELLKKINYSQEEKCVFI